MPNLWLGGRNGRRVRFRLSRKSEGFDGLEESSLRAPYFGDQLIPTFSDRVDRFDRLLPLMEGRELASKLL